MTGKSREHISVAIAPPESRRAALELLFCDQPEPERNAQVAAWLADASRDPAAFDGLLIATRHGMLDGAIVVRPQPGNTAIVWPPRPAQAQDDPVGIALADAALQWVSDRGIDLAQALLETNAADHSLWMVSAGFERAASLAYMAAETAACEDEPTALEYQPYDESQPDRLAAIVEQTYQGTLDCPRLNGVRGIDDVLAGYRASGRHDPARWLIVRHEGTDIGCLLLTDHPDASDPALSSWELLYMGLLPAARGRRWGVPIARHAVHLAGQAGRGTIALAVDAANFPALAIYSRAGFRQFAERDVFLKVCSPQG